MDSGWAGLHVKDMLLAAPFVISRNGLASGEIVYLQTKLFKESKYHNIQNIQKGKSE